MSEDLDAKRFRTCVRWGAFPFKPVDRDEWLFIVMLAGHPKCLGRGATAAEAVDAAIVLEQQKRISER